MSTLATKDETALPPLRPYQLDVVRAVLRSVLRGEGETFSVEIARQGGKNELSARLELALLASHADVDCTLVKAAPTLKPQAAISYERLWARLEEAGLAPWAKRSGGNRISVGRASQVFLSAEPQSNIVGHTASLLLEVDEAQDVDVDKFDRELRPMAASTGATTVFYGTAWDGANLLERAKQAHLEAERRDGRRRHFEYDWETVAQANPVYRRFVVQERERLGADHPIFLTQYCLRVLPGAGRLLTPTALSLLNGCHGRLDAPLAGETYIAGLDIAGEGESPGRHDSTVLTIARVYQGDGPSRSTSAEGLAFAGRDAWAPQVEVVRHYEWTGAPLVEVQGALLSLLKHSWRVERVAVDATGIGEPVAAFLRGALGGRVDAIKLSAETKSRLGFDLIAAANCGRLRLYGAGEAAEGRECRRQLERCRATYRPNRTLAFAVDAADGHDDYVVSLALAVAAANGAQPRRARGRAPTGGHSKGGPSWLF